MYLCKLFIFSEAALFLIAPAFATLQKNSSCKLSRQERRQTRKKLSEFFIDTKEKQLDETLQRQRINYEIFLTNQGRCSVSDEYYDYKQDTCLSCENSTSPEHFSLCSGYYMKQEQNRSDEDLQKSLYMFSGVVIALIVWISITLGYIGSIYRNMRGYMRNLPQANEKPLLEKHGNENPTISHSTICSNENETDDDDDE